jgi:tRNA threonylcarbamoyladenosine biosynthesis protein TsaE
MNPYVFISESEADTLALGAALAETLPGGTTISLCGTLGAGKTRLVQAIAQGLGFPRTEVVSPTFVLVQEYPARRKIIHIDAYRLKDVDEFEALGPDEFFGSDGLVFIEWADRIAEALPRERVEIEIEVLGLEKRRFEIRAVGRSVEEFLRKITHYGIHRKSLRTDTEEIGKE